MNKIYNHFVYIYRCCKVYYHFCRYSFLKENLRNYYNRLINYDRNSLYLIIALSIMIILSSYVLDMIDK